MTTDRPAKAIAIKQPRRSRMLGAGHARDRRGPSHLQRHETKPQMQKTPETRVLHTSNTT
ncbi:hypothetical protein RISK_006206 [Rhodopirellula islandica]|uniref:Uncharacterized protein n=1 Tax=Rhodopirellula islandica TaxID=595434 RepID=A0A0J1B4P8_RHOIS|nr:hypothetical protein RISK_006206 [Rhodopirellula islandica]